MYPFIRTALVLRRAKRQPAIGPGDHSDIPLTCWPWDCDMFIEMNNGRHLTLYDLGRFDFGARFGLPRVLRENRWGLVVAGGSIRYRKRILPFEKFTLRTRLLGRDERWFYFQQSTMRHGEVCSSGLMRTGVTAKGRVIPTQEAAEALGFPDWSPNLPPWVAAWAEADHARPWPPEASQTANP